MNSPVDIYNYRFCHKTVLTPFWGNQELCTMMEWSLSIVRTSKFMHICIHSFVLHYNICLPIFTEKYIKSKLLMGLLAIVLVIKLIKLKLFFFLPLILGVHNAKKLFLKLVLFVFPALTHIFKLCSWYHDNYHQTKYHHHHHQISHLHHSVSL